ncbi:MAG: ROK family protein [Schwartzia sp.]|nr:ROK family protein [Schwartzia sp. (in: firmicutes)]
MPAYALFDIGGTAVKCGVADENGTFLMKERRDNPIRVSGLAALKALLEERLTAYGDRYAIAGVGVSTAGVVDEAGRVVYISDSFPGYAGTRLAEVLTARRDLPVAVENDAACAGLGEFWLGAGQGASPLVCLTVGTGVGGCVIVDGKVVRGAHGFAGEVGFIPLADGTLEEAAATSALCRSVAAAKRRPAAGITGEQVFEWARAGDPVAKEAICHQMAALADGLVPVCYTVDPAVVVIGGAIAAQADYLEPLLRDALRERLLPTLFEGIRFGFARLGNDAGLLGALYCLRQRLAGDS